MKGRLSLDTLSNDHYVRQNILIYDEFIDYTPAW